MERDECSKEIVIRLSPSLYDDITEFAWDRSMARTEAILLLIRQGLFAKDSIETPDGDRWRNPDEVVVDSRLQ
jgi:hypothetical protein